MANFASDVSSAGGVSPVSLKNCKLYLLRGLGFNFETAYSRALNSLQGRCLSLAILSGLLKLGMLNPYVVFRINTSKGWHNVVTITYLGAAFCLLCTNPRPPVFLPKWQLHVPGSRTE